MKKTLKSIVFLSTLCGGVLHGSFEFRTPLSAQWRGYFHWQLSPVVDAWWYPMMPSEKKNTAWDFHTWGVAYTRSASRAFISECGNHNTRHRTSLAPLFFGQEVFRGEDVFAGGTFAGASNQDLLLVNNTNPFLAFARITPVFDYNEKGAFMGVEFSRNFGRDERWHAGARVSIPYKIIEIEQDNDGFLEETLADVFATRIVFEDEGAVEGTEFAARFDFLSSLATSAVNATTGETTIIPFIRYNNEGATAGTIDIGSQRLTGTSADESNTVPAAYGTKSTAGTLPSVPFRKLPSQVSGALGENGQGNNNTTYFFQTGTDYNDNLRLHRDAQGTIFITSRAENVGESNTTKTTSASDTVLEEIRAIINGNTLFASELASTFFLNKGINLAGYSRHAGIGDLFAEGYVGFGDKQDWFVDGLFGVSFPTGTKQKNSNELYFKSTGNNNHFEIKLGIDTGWMPYDWFAFEIDAAYHHVFRRTENRAATFTGATVINIGPELQAKVSWDYFVGRADFNFFHPHNPDLGVTFGYELFVKSHDHVKFECDATTATDLLGRPNQPLAPCNYERHTNSLSNKLRAQIFNRWNYFEIFGGGSQVVAGRRVMKETEGHLGFVVYF